MSRSPMEIEFDSSEQAEVYVDLAQKMVSPDIIAFCGKINEGDSKTLVKLSRSIPEEIHKTIHSRACGKRQTTPRFRPEDLNPMSGSMPSTGLSPGPTFELGDSVDEGDFEWLDPDNNGGGGAPENSNPVPKEKLPFYVQELIGKIQGATQGVDWDVVLLKALADYKTALEDQIRKDGVIFPLVLLNFEGYIAVMGLDLRPEVIKGLSAFIKKKINQGKLYEYAIVAEGLVEDDSQLAEYLTVQHLKSDKKKFVTLLYSSSKMEQMEATEIYQENNRTRTGKWKMLNVNSSSESLFFEKSILDLSFFTNLW